MQSSSVTRASGFVAAYRLAKTDIIIDALKYCQFRAGLRKDSQIREV
jgi:hypothetical protein